MSGRAHLMPVPDASEAPTDPLTEARAAGNAEVDAGLDALGVALLHFANAERYRDLLPEGAMQLLDGLQITTPKVVLAISAIRGRAAR